MVPPVGATLVVALLGLPRLGIATPGKGTHKGHPYGSWLETNILLEKIAETQFQFIAV